MTRTKRMTAAVLTLVLLLNFAGCGAKNALFDRVSGAGKFAAESLTIYEEKGSFAAEPKTVWDAKQAEEIFGALKDVTLGEVVKTDDKYTRYIFTFADASGSKMSFTLREDGCVVLGGKTYDALGTDTVFTFDLPRFSAALRQLEEKTGRLEYAERYACSSAAGGLRMIVSGLVPELTLEAARMASLGAGAKLIGQFSFELTEDDIDQIRREKPDIFLLVGGTDGGNTACILHNANMLAAMQPDFPIIVAGNRSAARQCERILAGCRVRVCENVMPKFGLLKTEQTQAAIREIFLSRIIQAKGLDHAAERMNDILMPTPAAVLKALELLSSGFGGEPGIGELAAVDVGGATTDVYSICEGMPRQMNTVYKGLPEPYAKRTVEGDIGMRYSVLGILDAVGARRLAELSGLPEQRVQTLCRMLSEQTELVPDCDGELAQLDHALACMAVSTAAKRHAGTIEETYTLLGQTFVQAGKDLTAVRRVVATGGSLIHSPRVREIASYFCYDPADPASLRPKNAEILIDSSYILAAMGLLSTHDPLAALQIMKRMIR